MHLNFLIVFGLLSIGFIRLREAKLQENNENQEAECRIYSRHHKRYLFATWKFLGIGSRRSLGLWRELTAWGYKSSDDFVPSYQLDPKDDSGLWSFEPVPDRPRTYFIRNIKYNNDYLRGSENYVEFFSKQNRGVYAEELKNRDDDDSFMWRIERSPYLNLYHIWNVKFSLPLYTINRGRDLFELGLSPKQPNLNEFIDDFNWFFKCRDDIGPSVRGENSTSSLSPNLFSVR